MIKSHFGKRIDRKPFDFGCIVPRNRNCISIDATDICHSHGPAARIAARVAERAELIELAYVDAGFFLKLSSCSRLQGLALMHKAAGQGPLTRARCILPTNEQHSRLPFICEKNQIHSQRRSSVLVAKAVLLFHDVFRMLVVTMQDVG